MTIQVEISPEAEANLAAQAVRRGIALELYASSVLEEFAAPRPTGTGKLRPGDVAEMTRVMTEGSEHLPILPPEVNDRASYYEDRW